MNERLVDSLGRPLRDLRLSVTDRCNFRCRYCMPSELFGPDFQFLPKDKLLTFEEMVRLSTLFAQLGVEKIRITGGEPLMRKDLPRLIKMLRGVKGIKDLAMTTNGSLLKKYAQPLKEAGLQRVTISLDSLDHQRFMEMNDRGYSVRDILEGIDAAQEAGLRIKINMVVQKGINDQDIIPMATYFKKKNHILRFIEYMDVGNTNGWKLDHVLPSKEIVRRINQVMPLEPVHPNYYGEVARRYRYSGTNQEIGLISSVTQAFCSTCTRARLSAEGSLYTCLFASEGTNLLLPLREGKSDKELLELIASVWKERKDRYSERRLDDTQELKRKKVEMSHIGG